MVDVLGFPLPDRVLLVVLSTETLQLVFRSLYLSHFSLPFFLALSQARSGGHFSTIRLHRHHSQQMKLRNPELLFMFRLYLFRSLSRALITGLLLHILASSAKKGKQLTVAAHNFYYNSGPRGPQPFLKSEGTFMPSDGRRPRLSGA